MDEVTPIKHTKETRKQAEQAVREMFEKLRELEYEFCYLVPGRGRKVFQRIMMGDTDVRAITPHKRRMRHESERKRIHPANDGSLRQFFDSDGNGQPIC